MVQVSGGDESGNVVGGRSLGSARRGSLFPCVHRKAAGMREDGVGMRLVGGRSQVRERNATDDDAGFPSHPVRGMRSLLALAAMEATEPPSGSPCFACLLQARLVPSHASILQPRGGQATKLGRPMEQEAVGTRSAQWRACEPGHGGETTAQHGLHPPPCTRNEAMPFLDLSIAALRGDAIVRGRVRAAARTAARRS